MKILTILTLLMSISAFGKVNKLKVKIANLPPWLIVKNKKCDSGPICRLFNYIDSKDDMEIEYTVSSLARVNMASYQGKIDIALFPLLDVFKKFYEPVGEYYRYKLGHYSKASDKQIKCTTYRSPHKQKDQKYVEVKSMEQCFNMLKAQRVTDILITDFELSMFLKTHKDLKVGKFTPFQDLSLWFYINKNLKEDVKKSLRIHFNSLDLKMIQSEFSF